MAVFAEKTSVSVIQTRADIEKVLARYGVIERQFTELIGKAVIQFRSKDRLVRFTLHLPDPEAKAFQRDGRGNPRSPDKKRAAWEQACRQKWRALFLGIKAKLEIVQSGISTFEEEFLAHVVMPDGRTVAEHATPMIAQCYEDQTTRPLLTYGGK